MAKPALEFVQAVSIGTGMAFAASCFAMAGAIVAGTGVWAAAAVLLAAGLILCVAFAIGRLARRFPSALGVRTYVKAAFGNGASLFVVYAYLGMIMLVGGIESAILARVVTHYLPWMPAAAVIGALVAGTAAVNLAGTHSSRNVQVATAALMLVGILTLCGGALHAAPAGALALSAPLALPGAAESVVTAFFLFVGFEWLTSAHSGSRNAARQLPAALVVSVMVLAGVYLAVVLAFAASLPVAQLMGVTPPQVQLAHGVWPAQGMWLALGLSALAAFTSFNAGIIGAARMLYSLAREGFAPAALMRTSARTATPHIAVLLMAGLAFVIGVVLDASGAVLEAGSISAVLVCLCYLMLLFAFLKIEGAASPRTSGRAALALGALSACVIAALLAAVLIANWTKPWHLATCGGLLLLALYCRRLARRAARGERVPRRSNPIVMENA